MAARDLFPNMPDDRDGGRFRVATSRRQELTLQQELDDVGKKSIADIIVTKELMKTEPLTTPERTVRKLAPEFTPQKLPGKRKSQPVFHDENEPARAKSPATRYNPLDKERTFTAKLMREDTKSNKLPYSKENTVTTEDMKKQRVTSLGVLPPQHGKAFPELNILMEGIPAQNHDDPILGPVQRANTAPRVEAEIVVQEATFTSAVTSRGSTSKPAILGQVGTLQAVTLAERPAPPAKPMSRLRVPRAKSAKSIHSDASSFTSVDIHLPSEAGGEDGRADVGGKTAATRGADEHRSQASSAMTMKSVKDLLEEAKKIASPEGSGKAAMMRRSEKRDEAKKPESSLPPKGPAKTTAKGATASDKRADLKTMGLVSLASRKWMEKRKVKSRVSEEPEETKERSVDEIIKSLKEQANSGVVSEADRKIQEIMNKVITRSKAVLGDIVPEDSADTEQPSAEGAEDALFSQTLGDHNGKDKGHDLDPCLTSQTPDQPQTGGGPEDVNVTSENEKEEKATDGGTEGQGQEPQIVVTEPAEEGPSEEQEQEQEQPSGHTAAIDEALALLSEVRTAESPTEDDKVEAKTEDTPDLTQAWEDLMAPADVSAEDILSVNAKPSQLHHKQPETTPTEPEPPVSLLGSWATITAPPSEQREAPPSEQRGPAAVKSIHHFCTVREDVQLPDPQRGVWRRYHVPSKYDYLYRQQQFPEEHSEVHNSPVTPGSMNTTRPPTASDSPPTAAHRPPSASQTALDRHQAAMAARILEEAAKVKDTTEGGGLEAWQQRAQQVFDQPELTIAGKKLALRSDESFLYWTPAPPKWDVAPGNVKAALFPDYHGAELSLDHAGMTGGGDEDEDEEEDEEEEQEDPEVKAARERILSRQHGSARDLTDLDKNKLQKAEQDIPESLRNIKGTVRLPDEVYNAALGDPDSVEYAAKRAQIEEVFAKVFTSLLGDQYRGVKDIAFSGGSLVVHYRVSVPAQAPPGLSEELEDGLRLAVTRGMFGDYNVDTAAISVEDDLTSKADVLMREMSNRSALISQMSPLKMGSRREQSDVTGMMTQRKDTAALTYNDQRRSSAPHLVDIEQDDTLLIYQDYATTMEEVKQQKEQLKNTKSSKKTEPTSDTHSQLGSTELLDSASKVGATTEQSVQQTESPRTTVRIEEESRSRFSIALSKQNEPKQTPSEEALEAGRSYVILPSKSKKKKKKLAPADMARIESIETFARQAPRAVTRRQSFTEKKRPVEWELRVPMRIRRRKSSLPRVLDFEQYKKEKFYKPESHESQREWVRDIWNKWFDKRYPPTPPESDWEDEDEDEDEEEDEERFSLLREDKPKRKSSIASTVYSVNVQVPLQPTNIEENESQELLAAEVAKLTAVMEMTEKPSAFDHCRRGAIQRKLGNIAEALEDLNLALSMEPQMLDALWHRHLAYLLLNKKLAALEDLNIILKYNKTHANAYRSRAAIHRDTGDITLAIVNYTQAIKHKPDDDDAYFQRAEMYEERGEQLLAMEDYAQTFRINPTKIEALFRHGMHYFNNGNWDNAIKDFTDLLKHDPHNAQARVLRGRTYVQLRQWTSAVEDLSAAVHLDPRNAKAFYYRACLLRKLHPKKALQDYSVSLMLDDSEDNIMSYLHRGILYNEIGRHEDAMPDFEAVLKLDKDVASAHVNLGLICMQKLHNHQRAIKKFSSAIKADPTYVKAYICRAEAYTQVHDYKNALLDITRAIHLKPDMNHLYMYRGQLVLKLGNLDLAAFCVRHAAELNAGLGQSPTQQAIVQTFLKNYDKAIEALESACRVKRVPQLFMLLGKTRMKAQLWKDAVDAFKEALALVELEYKGKMNSQKPWQTKQLWPPEAAEMNYLIGMCQMEMRDYLNAHDAFNSAIQVDKKLAEAYYWRGMCRMKLKQSKGIQDFNRALALDPDLFQAYLSRAAYYGLKGQYTKGILNCNEAIRLQSNSVRGYLYRGALKYHIKAYHLAIRDLSQAIATDSTCALAYFNRAVCYHDSGNVTKALQDYGVVLLLGEYLAIKVLINRGLLYLENRDYQNALHDFLMAAQVSPSDKRIHHTIGLCYHKLSRLEEAVRSFTRALQLDMYFLDALIGRGNVFMDYGHEIGHTYARHDYERALRFEPRCLPARVNLAYNLQVAGKYQQAWHQFTAAIALDNKFRPAFEGRAIINLQMSDTFAAFQDINASVNIQATAELLTNRGVIHQFMGDRTNAMRDYQQAIKLDSSYALAYFNAANIYFHTRQFRQACDYYDQTITHNPKDESAYLNRAISKVMLKDAPGALEDFEAAIRLSPHSAHTYFNRGNLYASLLQHDKAETDYCKALELRPDDPLVYKRRADVRGKLGQREAAITDYRRAILIQSQHGRRS